MPPALRASERGSSPSSVIYVGISVTKSFTTYTTIIFLGTFQQTTIETVEIPITNTYTTYTTDVVLGNSQEPTGTATANSVVSPSKSKSNAGAVAGGVLGGLCFIVILICCCRCMGRSPKRPSSQSSYSKRPSWAASNSSSSRSSRPAVRSSHGPEGDEHLDNQGHRRRGEPQYGREPVGGSTEDSGSDSSGRSYGGGGGGSWSARYVAPAARDNVGGGSGEGGRDQNSGQESASNNGTRSGVGSQNTRHNGADQPTGQADGQTSGEYTALRGDAGAVRQENVQNRTNGHNNTDGLNNTGERIIVADEETNRAAQSSSRRDQAREDESGPAPTIVEGPATPIILEAPAPVRVEAPAPIILDAPAPIILDADPSHGRGEHQEHRAEQSSSTGGLRRGPRSVASSRRNTQQSRRNTQSGSRPHGVIAEALAEDEQRLRHQTHNSHLPGHPEIIIIDADERHLSRSPQPMSPASDASSDGTILPQESRVSRVALETGPVRRPNVVANVPGFVNWAVRPIVEHQRQRRITTMIREQRGLGGAGPSRLGPIV